MVSVETLTKVTENKTGFLFRVFVFYEFVEFGFIGLWDDVPGLCAAPVVVVHRVYEQVFDMPTK